MNIKPVLIYHDNCPDGFGSAFVFWKKYGYQIDYIPLNHKNEPFKGLPEDIFKDRVVWMVDIALERNDLLRAKELSKDLIVLDHHLSAKKELEDLPFCYFDMDHSGSVLAWNYCFNGKPVPKLLAYIQDRDLYQNKLPDSEPILAAIDSYPKTFDAWASLFRVLESSDGRGFENFIAEGNAILRYKNNIMKMIKETTHLINIRGYKVPAVNTPFFRHELASELSEEDNNPFAAAYVYDGNNFTFSLRSNGEKGIDVTTIAESFPGGGGHKHAAGFSVKSLSELI